MRLSAADIVTACRCLIAGPPEGALDIVGEGPSESDAVADAIRLCAEGLIAERDGAASAPEPFGQAYELGLPLPEVLLVCGRHFLRTRRYDRAHQCYALLQNFEPHAIHELLEGLPSAERSAGAAWAVRRMMSAPRPDFYGLQPWKAALADHLGADGAAVAFAAMAGMTLGRVETLPLSTLRDHAQEYGRAYTELFPSRPVVLPPPRHVHAAPSTPVARQSRALFSCVLQDVVVSSKSNFLLADGRAVLDVQAGEREMFPLNLDVDPIVVAPTADTVTVVVERGAVHGPPLERALTLVGVHTYNFGHWLVEFLPRVWICMTRNGFEAVTILIDAQMHPQLRPALEFFVGPDHPIHVLEQGRAVRVDELWTCSTPVYFPVGPKPGESETDEPLPIDPQAFASLIGTIRPRLESLDSAGPARRIYLARQDSQHRRLVNRREVEAFFVANGFEVYDPGDLPFVEQLRRVREAEVVVGPDGSSMWLAFLARRGTRVGYLNNPFLEEHWWVQANHAALGHRFLILTGEIVYRPRSYRKFSDYRIDVNALDDFLGQLLED